MEETKYKVCILTAGKGARLGEYTQYFNKSLLRVGNKAVISHIIDSCPACADFVVALGYRGDLVRQYLLMAHPDKRFTFVDVDHWGSGFGPGYALSKCKEYLQCPFYYWSCDTIFPGNLTFGSPKNNVIHCGKIDEGEQKHYCTVDSRDCDHCGGCGWEWKDDTDTRYDCSFCKGGKIFVDVYDKDPKGTTDAFTGVAFIKDFEHFWMLMEDNQAKINDEIQISPALFGLNDIQMVFGSWFDTGNIDGLKKARNYFGGLQNLDKIDEEIYLFDDFVVKYFYNKSLIQNRLKRANIISDYIPQILSSSENFYKYKYVKGKDLFHVKSPDTIMQELLSYCKETIWKKQNLSHYDKVVFADSCIKFYKDKTESRIEKLKEKGVGDKACDINGCFISDIESVLKGVDWQLMSRGYPCFGHGDFNFSNIVQDTNGRFVLLDWRQEFGGLVETFDAYYDFAKMYHSFLLPHNSIKDEKYYIKKSKFGIKTFIEIPYELERCKDIFEDFLIENSFDLKKIKQLTGLVLLNMSPLHEYPLDSYLFYFGKWYLQKNL